MTTRRARNTITTTIKNSEGIYITGEEVAKEAVSYYQNLLGPYMK